MGTHNPGMEDRPRGPYRGMALRWKLLVGLGAVLLALAFLVEWPPPSDPSLPQTKAFLVFLGAVVGIAGLLLGLSQD